MASKLSIAWLTFQFLASFSTVSGYCPPLIKGDTIDVGYAELDYYGIGNQEDADRFKTCYDIRNELVITGYNSSGPLIIDGPRHVSTLKFWLLSSNSNPLLTSVTMTSLVSVGSMQISCRRQANTTSSDIGVLNFPALKKSGRIAIWGMDYVHTVNFPVLKEVGHLSISIANKLRTFNAPNIKSIGGIEIGNTPSLKTIKSFATKLKGVVKAVELRGTALTEVTFPNIKVLNRLDIFENENLTSVSLPLLTEVRDMDYIGGGTIGVQRNNPNLILSLPKLKTVTATVHLSGLREINIPELTTIGKYTESWQDPGCLYVNVGQAWNQSSQEWSIVPIPTYLTDFSAPKLRTVEGIIAFDAGSELRNISFPRLKEVKEIRINNTAASEFEDGIWMPNIRKVENILLIGKEPHCDLFESLYCRGKVKTNFTCGKFEKELDYRGPKDWPNFPPSCAGRANVDRSWVDIYDIRLEFLHVAGLAVVLSPFLWCVMRRWRLLWRISWRTVQRCEPETKGITD